MDQFRPKPFLEYCKEIGLLEIPLSEFDSVFILLLDSVLTEEIKYSYEIALFEVHF